MNQYNVEIVFTRKVDEESAVIVDELNLSEDSMEKLRAKIADHDHRLAFPEKIYEDRAGRLTTVDGDKCIGYTVSYSDWYDEVVTEFVVWLSFSLTTPIVFETTPTEDK